MDRMVESHRGLAEQIVELRTGLKAIQVTLERLERQIESRERTINVD